jgi:hypothetical protein
MKAEMQRDMKDEARWRGRRSRCAGEGHEHDHDAHVPVPHVPTITHMHAFAAAQSGTGRPAHVASWARMHVHGSSPNISEEQIDECTYASAAVHGEQFAFAHRQEEEWGKRRPFGLLTQV